MHISRFIYNCLFDRQTIDYFDNPIDTLPALILGLNTHNLLAGPEGIVEHLVPGAAHQSDAGQPLRCPQSRVASPLRKLRFPEVIALHQAIRGAGKARRGNQALQRTFF